MSPNVSPNHQNREWIPATPNSIGIIGAQIRPRHATPTRRRNILLLSTYISTVCNTTLPTRLHNHQPNTITEGISLQEYTTPYHTTPTPQISQTGGQAPCTTSPNIPSKATFQGFRQNSALPPAYAPTSSRPIYNYSRQGPGVGGDQGQTKRNKWIGGTLVCMNYEPYKYVRTAEPGRARKNCRCGAGPVASSQFDPYSPKSQPR